MTWEAVNMAVAFLTGLILGGAYLAILWRSIRGLAASRGPIRRLLGGAVLRIGLLMGSFYLVMAGQPERLLACLAGFLVVRVAATRWAGRGAPPEPAA